MHQTRPPSSLAASILLIAAPLIGFGLKTFSFGWVMVIVLVLIAPIVILVLGYALQVAVALQVFVSKKRIAAANLKRATVAAWLTSIGIVALGIFMPDGGDASRGSTLQTWMGSYGPRGDAVLEATDGINDAFALISLVLWLGGFLWLIIEWIISLTARRRASVIVYSHPPQAGSSGPSMYRRKTSSF